jgi:hypothetical protein
MNACTCVCGSKLQRCIRLYIVMVVAMKSAVVWAVSCTYCIHPHRPGASSRNQCLPDCMASSQITLVFCLEYCVLGCDAVWCGMLLPLFQMILVLPHQSCALNMEAAGASDYQIIWYNIPGDSLCCHCHEILVLFGNSYFLSLVVTGTASVV